MKRLTILLSLLFTLTTHSQVSSTLITEINDENYSEHINAKSSLSILFLSAPWCHWCKKMGQDLENLAHDYQDKIKIYKLDYASSAITMSELTNYTSVPQAFFLYGTKKIPNVVEIRGYQPYSQFISILKSPRLYQEITKMGVEQ